MMNVFSAITLPRSTEKAIMPKVFFYNTGLIMLNRSACRKIGITPGCKVSFSHDEQDLKNWYVFIDEENGFEVRPSVSSVGGCIFSHKKLIAMFYDVFGWKYTANKSFLIAVRPVSEANIKLWGILIDADPV